MRDLHNPPANFNRAERRRRQNPQYWAKRARADDLCRGKRARLIAELEAKIPLATSKAEIAALYEKMAAIEITENARGDAVITGDGADVHFILNPAVDVPAVAESVETEINDRAVIRAFLRDTQAGPPPAITELVVKGPRAPPA